MSALGAKIKDVMVGFEKGQLIGIDIGLSAIKICLLSKTRKGIFRVDKYLATPLSEAAIIEDEIQKPDEVVEIIAETIKELKIKRKIACLGMNGPNTVTKRLQVPDGPRDEVEDNILWESEQYIPFGADDSEIGFSVIGVIEDEDVVDAAVGALKTDLAVRYSEYLSEAGLNARVIDLNVFATVNAFEYIYHNSLEEISDLGAIIIDFGAQYTTVIVYRNSGPILTKEINLGGVLITEEIQRTMGVSYSEAEDLKVNGDDNGNLPEEILEIVDQHTAKVLQELRKTLNFYIAAGSSEQVGRCFITGGSSRLPGLVDSLHDLIEINVEIINPFEAFELGYTMSDDEIENAASCGLVALGLGMRSV